MSGSDPFESVYAWAIDPLSGLLDGPRARAAFVLRALLDPPWSMLIRDEAPLTVVAVTRGHAWYLPDGGDAQLVGEGDVIVVRGPDPYVVADAPDTTPGIVIEPGQVCRSLDGQELAATMGLGVRTWGNSATGETAMVVGTYVNDGQISAALLDALPTAIHLRADRWRSPVAGLLAEELPRDAPGQQVVLDRLVDLLLIGALRAAFACGAAAVPRWLAAHDDPVVGGAIRLMHADPAAPWTVASLARAVGVSRALLARRFHEVVGQPPAAFLTEWRMALAADLLHEPDATVTSVAAAVGYGSPFTFSTAFKRHHGRSPRHWRVPGSIQ